jgi:hypothetical protein
MPAQDKGFEFDISIGWIYFKGLSPYEKLERNLRRK